jgi:hypothetical protein
LWEQSITLGFVSQQSEHLEPFEGAPEYLHLLVPTRGAAFARLPSKDHFDVDTGSELSMDPMDQITAMDL